MTYKEASEYIEQNRKYINTPGKGGLKELCWRLGEPQLRLRFISVMGVNGRKAVTAYLSSLLKGIGYKTGSYNLSAVIEERERIQVNGRPITKQGLCEALERVLEIAGQMEAEGRAPLSLWEIETAMAFLYFVEKECDVVVWESRYFYAREIAEVLPAPMAMVYTPVYADSMQFTSERTEEIAELLAGYMKAQVPVISAKQLPKVEQILRQQAQRLECSYDCVDEKEIRKVKYGLEKQRFTYKGWKDLELSVGGAEEIEYAVLAILVTEVIIRWEQDGKLPRLSESCRKPVQNTVSETVLRKALLQTKWNGCMTVLGKKPYFIAKEVMNEVQAREFAGTLTQAFADRRMIFIVGSLRTMEYEAVIRQTFEMAQHIITLTVREDADGMHAYELAGEVQRYHPSVTAVDSPEEAVELAHLLADKDSVIVAFGALEGLGGIMRCIMIPR